MQKMERMPGDAIHVCVDAYPNRVLQGRLQSAAWVGEMPFVSLMDFFFRSLRHDLRPLLRLLRRLRSPH